ncbi:MAG: hypothetical protein EBQ83_03375 [Burkholderiaceae bacterium]|jgi:hypothetical protein|nr:hypothetical protein [Burkholderiaceae bacterium]
MNSSQQKEFLEATAWIRPLTKWSALFAFKTQGFLPMWIRNLPLKAVKKILTGYQKKYQNNSCNAH